MESNKEFTPALGYNWLTAVYDEAVKITMPENKFRRLLIDMVNPQSREHIQEFGFGTAQNIILLKQRSPETLVEGVDIDPKVKRIAEKNLQKKNLKAPLLLYDGKTIPFESNRFYKVFSSLVLHHFDKETKMQCLGELYRVMKPDGELIIADWGRPKTKLMRLAFFIVQFIDGFKTTSDNVKGKLVQYVSNAGFKSVTEHISLNTSVGTLCYYKATK